MNGIKNKTMSFLFFWRFLIVQSSEYCTLSHQIIAHFSYTSNVIGIVAIIFYRWDEKNASWQHVLMTNFIYLKKYHVMTIHVAVLGYATMTKGVKNLNVNVRPTRLEMDTTATVSCYQGFSKGKGIDYLCVQG